MDMTRISDQPLRCLLLTGPGCQLAPGSRSTLKVQEGATLALLTGSYFTRSSNQVFGCGNANYVFMSPDPKGVVMALDRSTGNVR